MPTSSDGVKVKIRRWTQINGEDANILNFFNK